ncbi:hypothetical protein [Halobaculum sp. MBLA0143]|uniref:DUF7861 family protein n=1 Tax=Halobaculum sp. MBLA0143 TaxID=3079933 RepID=UPI00352313D1
MNHDRIHSRPPQQDPERWREGVIRSLTERDGHAVFVVAPVEGAEDGAEADDAESVADGERETVELTVTTAVRDLAVGRLEIDEGESPVGEHVWFRERGG